MKTLQTKLDAIRGQIEALNAERDQTEAAPISRTECEDLIAAVISAPYTETVINPGSNARVDLNPAPTGLLSGTFDSRELLNTLERPAVLRAVIPAALQEYLIGCYDASIGDTAPGLPAVERRARLAEIANQVFKLEVQEEAIIEELEAAGGDVARRADADPAAQLGLGARDTAA